MALPSCSATVNTHISVVFSQAAIKGTYGNEGEQSVLIGFGKSQKILEILQFDSGYRADNIQKLQMQLNLLVTKKLLCQIVSLKQT